MNFYVKSVLNMATTLACLGLARGLKCYKTDPETGEVEIAESDKYHFCLNVPDMRENAHEKHENSKTVMDGVTEKELDEDYGKIFNADQTGYQKYDWPSIFHASPKFHDKIPHVEYQFRCLCNTDFCNGAKRFDEYVQNLKKIHS